MKDPAAVTSGSAKKVWWVCDCGREIEISVYAAVKAKSCGHCNDIPIASITGKKYGKLSLLDAKGLAYTSPGSHRKLTWSCDCGRTTEAQARYVTSDKTKSCGRCNEIEGSELIGKKFGRLRMRDPHTVKANSNKKVWWTCDCGREIFSKVFAVTRGNAKSCGRCYLSIKEKWEQGKDGIRKLKTPIFPNQLPDWCPRAMEPIFDTGDPFCAHCPLCGEEYFPRWSGIRNGKSLTCGCSMSQVSSGQKEILDFIQKLEVEAEAELEHEIKDLSYDIFIPSRKLVIEYNGLRWHSKKYSKKRDIDKWKNAVEFGYDYLMIFEDEWLHERMKVENLLRNKLGLGKPLSLRPQVCEIRKLSKQQADVFHEEHHYIGKAVAPINYGVIFNGEVIACCSFKKPTRQSKHSWELVRMASHWNFRVHGIWSKLLNLFISEEKPSSIVSFSDNRLFDGRTYEKIGFKLDGDVAPDYYWVKGSKRYHKSGLRKTTEEKTSGKTETELREAQGYARIWDLGKKRWVWTPSV